MNYELQLLFSNFEEQIRNEDKINSEKDDPNGKYNFYIPKIRDYFLVYIDKQITSHDYQNRMDLYFNETFNRESIIGAAIYYIENYKARDISNINKERKTNAIRDFLIAYNRFYDIILKSRYNIFPFQIDNLFLDIRIRLENMGYILLDSEQYPAIRQAEYTFICKHYNNQSPLQDKQLQVWIILQLSFLYGLSFSTLRNLQASNIDFETRTLKVLNKSKDKIIILELPFHTFKDIELHIRNNKLKNNEFLFFTRAYKNNKAHSKPIIGSFLSEEFNTLRKLYLAQQNHDEYIGNRFTHYGIIKYAISNMLECNMNIPAIICLTGRDIKFILSCNPEKSIKTYEQSNYTNSILRGINTFMDFNY